MYKILAIILVLLTGCQQLPTANLSTATTQPTDTPEPTSTPEPEPTDTPVPEPETIAFTSEQLAQALFTLDELPTGWTISNSEIGVDEDIETYPFLCGEQSNDSIARARNEYQAMALGPFLALSINQVPDIAVSMVEIRDILDECGGEHSDGETTITYSDMSFPDIGDDMIATRMNTDKGLMIDRVSIAKGNFLVLVAYVGLEALSPIDSNDTVKYVELVLEKLDQLE